MEGGAGPPAPGSPPPGAPPLPGALGEKVLELEARARALSKRESASPPPPPPPPPPAPPPPPPPPLKPQRPLRRPRPARSLALTGGAGRLAVHELTRGKELSIIPPTPGVKPAGTGGFSAGVSAGGGGA